MFSYDYRKVVDESAGVLCIKYKYGNDIKLYEVCVIEMRLLIIHWNISIITLTLTVTFSYMYRKGVGDSAGVLFIKYKLD